MSNEEPKGFIKLNKYENKADLEINGIIGWDVWDASVMWMLDQLQDVEEINVDLDSNGGSVLDGITIHNLLKSHKAKVNINIIGKAISMGSGVAMSGDHVTMMDIGAFMLHNPWNGIAGDAKDMRRNANTLDALKSTLVTAYVNKSGLSRTVISNMMDEETWLTPQQALAKGFIDEVIKTSESKAAAHFIPEGLNFNNVPEFAQDLIKKETQNMSTETPIEGVIAPDTQENTPVVNTPVAPEQPATPAIEAPVVNRCPKDVQNLADLGNTILNLTEKNNSLVEANLAKDQDILNLTAEKDKAIATCVKAQNLATKIGVNLAAVEEEEAATDATPKDIWRNMPKDTQEQILARAEYWVANIKNKK